MSATDTVGTGAVSGTGTPAKRKRRRKVNPKARLASLTDIDGRTVASRRARDFLAQLAADLGGADTLSAAQTAIAERCALLLAFLEHAEAQWLTGHPLDESYLPAAGVLHRMLTALGLKRQPKVIDPREYMRAVARQPEQST